MSFTGAIAAAIVAAAVALTYWAPLRRFKAALGVAHLFATGHIFLLFGVVVGLIIGDDGGALWSFVKPIVGFVVGWIGFSAGMRFDRRVLGHLPRRVWLVALAPHAAAGLAVAGASVALLIYAQVELYAAIASALVLGAAAASSGPTLIAVLRSRRAGRDREVRTSLRMMELSAGVDDLVVIALALAAFTVMQPADAHLSHAAFAAVSIGIGAALGAITWLFLGGRTTDEERLLLGLGMLALVAGIAGWLQMSPASVAAVAGITLVNLPGSRGELLFVAIRRVERPAVVILMTIVGFDVIGPSSWVFFPLFGLMVALRMGVKLGVGELVSGPITSASGLTAQRGWSLGLVPQGTFGLLVAVTLYDVWQENTGRAVLAAIAAAGLVNEVIAPALLWRGVKRMHRDAAARAAAQAPPPTDAAHTSTRQASGARPD